MKINTPYLIIFSKNRKIINVIKLSKKIFTQIHDMNLRLYVNIIMGVFDIWHIALETNGEDINHGIYANGLLVETAFERILQERMKIIDK